MTRTPRSRKGAGLATLLGLLLLPAAATRAAAPADDLAGQLVDLGQPGRGPGPARPGRPLLRKALELDPGDPDASRGRSAWSPSARRRPRLRPPRPARCRGRPRRRGGGQHRARHAARPGPDPADRPPTSGAGSHRARELLRQSQPEAAETTLRLALTALDSADQVPAGRRRHSSAARSSIECSRRSAAGRGDGRAAGRADPAGVRRPARGRGRRGPDADPAGRPRADDPVQHPDERGGLQRPRQARDRRHRRELASRSSTPGCWPSRPTP